jgi:hypothetical protein
MTDILDAIADTHPELVYSMNSLRNGIETSMDVWQEDEGVSPQIFSEGDTVDVLPYGDCPTNLFRGTIVKGGWNQPEVLSPHVFFTVTDQNGDCFDVYFWQLSKVGDENG